MSARAIQSVLEQHYTQITTPERGVYRAEKWYQQNPIAICYFDINRGFLNADFDLTEYQDKLLWRDYYAHEGPVQWNYYLYFICSESDLGVDDFPHLKMIIESDRVFARKFVVEDAELEDVLSEGSNETRSVALPGDIATVWREKLEQIDLADVASRKHYTTVVKEYMDRLESGKAPCTGPAATTPSKPAHEHSVDFIEELVLDRFRAFPNGQSLSLKPVNLILGPNGVGKTSLLEAIELNLCGATSRSYGDSEPAHIGLRMAGEQGLQTYQQDNNAFYRERDLSWYSNAYPTGSRLHRSFRRFNFFDSDAAYRLSESEDANEIAGAVASLFMGKEASWIEERADGFVSRFEPELRARRSEIAALNRTIEEAQAELQAAQSALPSIEQINEDFAATARACGWRGVLPSAQAECMGMEKLLDRIASRLSSIHSSIPWLARVTSTSVREEMKRANAAVDDIAGLERQVEEHNQARSETQLRAGALAQVIEQADRIERYLVEPASGRLVGLSSAIREASNRANRLSSVSMRMEGIDLGSFANIAEDIARVRARAEAAYQSAIKARSESAESLRRLGAASNRIQEVIAHIRVNAAEFLELVPDAQFCPFCNHKHGEGELEDIVGNLPDHYGASIQLDKCTAELAELDERVAKAGKERDQLGAIDEAAGLLFESQASKGSLEDIVKSLSAVKCELTRSQQLLSDLSATSTLLESKGLREDEYESLLAWFGQNGEAARIDISSIERFSESSAKLLSERQQLLFAESEYDAEIRLLTTEKHRRLAEYFGPASEAATAADVGARTAALEESVSALSEVAEQLEIAEEDTISGIEQRVKDVRNALGRFETGLGKRATYAASHPLQQQKLKEAHARLLVLEPAVVGLGEAITVLREIGEGQAKQDYLTALVRSSLESITSIFRKIHTPREFSDVRFDGKEISLVREGLSRVESLTRISTGQRSALALSIFLALNDRLAGHPPYLLLDDPVAHTDDLNILTFLDYLRSKVITGKRQLFFATASQRIGNLFRMKFEGLGPEVFGVIDLTDPDVCKRE